MARKDYMLAAIAALTPVSASAAELSLDEVWRLIAGESKVQQASQLDAQAASEAKDNAGLHWLPRVYLDARGYKTNDPGLSFFGALSQRSVTAADFNPASLNQPESRWYTRGALGLDLPIYEGGMKVAQVEAREHYLSGKKAMAEHAELSQFAEVARAYGFLGSLIEQREKLDSLQGTLNRLLKAYRLGNKSNQVGYSGLLGLRTLSNRIQGLLAENQARALSNKLELQEMGLRREDWNPKKFSLPEFLGRNFPLAPGGESASLAAQKEMALAAESGVKMERARYLPRIGAFAEEYLFTGSRKTETGYSAGLYLQWNLFSPGDYGLAKEARLKAEAASLFASASAEQERAESRGMGEAIKALLENLRLMAESEKLLEEQTSVAESLFRNGSINALQLVEALARRTDLVAAHAEAKLSLLKLHAELAKKTNFEISKIERAQ